MMYERVRERGLAGERIGGTGEGRGCNVGMKRVGLRSWEIALH